MKMSASHEKSPTELASGSTQATEAAVLFPSVFGCQFVQLWPVGRCQNETRNVLGLIQNGPCQVDQISSQSEGGHLTGTQAEGKWIPQDFHVPFSVNNRPLPEDIISQRGSLGMEFLRSDAMTFSDSEAVSTESSVRLSAEDDEISESSSWAVCFTGQSEGKS